MARASASPSATYRHEIVDHAVPLRLIGRSPRPHRQLSRALSYVRQNPGEVNTRATTNGFIGFLNKAEEVQTGAAERFVKGVAGCRAVLDDYLRAMEVSSSSTKDNDGSLWLAPDAKNYHEVEDALHAVGAVTHLLKDEVFGGQDPSKVDAAVSRTGGLPSVTTIDRNGIPKTDTDRMFRLGSDPTAAPRLPDPQVYDRWQEGLRLNGASEAIRRGMGTGRFAGARAFMTTALTLADLFCSRRWGIIDSPDKGSDGKRTLELEPKKTELKRLLDYVDGERAKLSGLSLKRIRALAADPRRRHELASMPLFTEDGVSFIKYDRLYRVCRRAAERMDLFICDDEYRRTGVKRWVTFHFLRHEYVHDRLDHIETLPASRHARARRSLIAYMGWSGEGMLLWYSAHHVLKLSGADAREYNDTIDARAEVAVCTPERAGAPATSRFAKLLKGLK